MTEHVLSGYICNMNRKPGKSLRILFIGLLVTSFGVLAFLLWKKQQERYEFASFAVENETHAVYIADADRLNKLTSSADELGLPNLPSKLQQAITAFLSQHDFKLADAYGPSCYLSYNQENFLIVFNTSAVSGSAITHDLTVAFDSQAELTAEGFSINGQNFYLEQYAHFLVISTQRVKPISGKQKIVYGNADFIVFSAEQKNGVRHILTQDMHHRLEEDSIPGPGGNPLLHKPWMNFVPAAFSEIHFFGSGDFANDAITFFNTPDAHELTQWMDQGFIFVKKDSFELIIGIQNAEFDLRRSLEEIAVNEMTDSTSLAYFNIGPYQVLPYRHNKNWAGVVQHGGADMEYFTQLNEFNILANSIPAMRWYLGEVQLGNLFMKNTLLAHMYQNTLPARVHTFQLINHQNGQFDASAAIWRNANICLQVSCESGNTSGKAEGVDLITSFDCEIIPTELQLLQANDSLFLLASNQTQLVLYNAAGEKLWRLNLSTPLTGAPQIVDLENDNKDEIVVFQQDQLDIVSINGKSMSGLPKKFGGTSKGGIAVNYDNAYNYRFLVSVDNQIKSLDETGTPVVGWMFNTMTANLKGEISYYVTQGKDMISFKDISNNQYVINRRGESRLTKPVNFSLPNEAGFVIGNYDETSFRKLGYRNNYIINYFLLDGHRDSVKLDKEVNALNASWIFNNNQTLLVIEEFERVVVLDEFGYEKESVLKPVAGQSLARLLIHNDFTWVFADNSQNALYLLDRFGKMIFPVPVNGSAVFEFSEDILYTFTGSKIKIYKTKNHDETN